MNSHDENHSQFSVTGHEKAVSMVISPVGFALAALILFMFSTPWAQGNQPEKTTSPYAGQQERDIKALSAGDIEGLLKGKGMGFAKAAELNHFPGPRHVLDLKSELKLTNQQLQKTQVLFDAMQKKAMALGKQILSREKELDHLFASGTVGPGSLGVLTKEIGRLTGELRNTHLATHLEMGKILGPEQISRYDALRGYGPQKNADASPDAGKAHKMAPNEHGKHHQGSSDTN